LSTDWVLTRPLYLSASFFETKAVEQLLGPGGVASDTTDQPGRLYLVADSALYTADGRREIDTVYWLTRVPHPHTLAQRVIRSYARQDMGPEDDQGYAY
jgi:hypothetical protein